MSSKRPHGLDLIPNPFIKKRNLGWTLAEPHLQSTSQPTSSETDSALSKSVPTTAAIESGSVQIDDHLLHFSTHLASYISPLSPPPPLSIDSYKALYTANAGSPNGAHFVIHQHDHPIAGTHYDLRLQINESSSVSWAIMYGLPGDPNSSRLNRNATETRIHSLWNHLIETASSATGSLLIWDTGTYTVLPRKSKHAPNSDPSSPTSSPSPPSFGHHSTPSQPSQQALLHAAFQNRKIRLRLHGSRLPDPYVVNLRLTKSEDAVGRARSNRTPHKRRRRRHAPDIDSPANHETTDEEDLSDDDVVTSSSKVTDNPDNLNPMEREIQELEDEHVRRTNAYPGAINTIDSVYQRRWYLSMDRRACGLLEKRTKGLSEWVLDQSLHGDCHVDSTQPTATNGFETTNANNLSYPFYVRGAEYERSVVTGRHGIDILKDEGVKNFVPRKGWAPILH